MIPFLTTRLPLLVDNMDSGSGSVGSAGKNPFTGFMHVVGEYAGPIQTFAYTVAVITAIVVFMMLMFAGQQLRARLKQKLLWIAVGVVGVTVAGYLVGYMKQNGRDTDFHTIVPALSGMKAYLATVVPNVWPF